MWSPEGVSLRPRSIPYDFGSVTTRRRFSQVTHIIPILETLVAVIDSRGSWLKHDKVLQTSSALTLPEKKVI